MMTTRWTALLVLALGGTVGAQAQSGTPEAEARSRELSERMRVTLELQAKELSKMQRELQRAARSESGLRDSIVRVASQRIAELASEIARVQIEADRVQLRMVDAATRAQLAAQIQSARAMGDVTRALANQQRVLTFSTRSTPKGYLGVTLNSEQRTEPRDGKVFTVFLSPAVIELVAPGSPAARVGLEAGDTIVAFGRFSVPGAVPMGDVMVPGERLQLRIRGRAAERQVPVTVGTREMRGTVSINGSVGSSTPFDLVPPEPAAPPRPPAVPGQSRSPTVPAAPSVGVRMYEQRGTSWSSGDYSIAGAMMTSITSELESLTGVSEGILVLRVAPGLPAATSGLRGGDVIVRVNDEDAEGVSDLQRAVQRASSRGERRVPLVVSRKQKETAITLQW